MDGGAEAEAEDAHIRHDVDGMLPTLEHPAVDPNSPLATFQVNGIPNTTTKNGAMVKNTMDTKTDTTTKTTRGRETIPGEGIKQEPVSYTHLTLPTICSV